MNQDDKKETKSTYIQNVGIKEKEQEMKNTPWKRANTKRNKKRKILLKSTNTSTLNSVMYNRNCILDNTIRSQTQFDTLNMELAIAINVIHVLRSSANMHKRNSTNWLQCDKVARCKCTFDYINWTCLRIVCLYSLRSAHKIHLLQIYRKEKHQRNRQTCFSYWMANKKVSWSNGKAPRCFSYIHTYTFIHTYMRKKWKQRFCLKYTTIQSDSFSHFDSIYANLWIFILCSIFEHARKSSTKNSVSVRDAIHAILSTIAKCFSYMNS